MRTYDIIFILDEKKVDDGGENFTKDVAAHVKALGGNIKERIAMGRRMFARPIGKNTAGVYWEFVTELDPSKVGLFQDKYRLNPIVLRLAAFDYRPPAPSRRPAASILEPGMPE